MKKDLIIYGMTYQVENKDLEKNIKILVNTAKTLSDGAWKVAFACYDIVTKEQYKEDFESLNKFCDAININKSLMSKYVNGVAFYLNVLQDMGYTTDNMTYGKCYLLGSLGDDFKKFMKYYSKVDLTIVGQTQLEKMIKAFKERNTKKESNVVNDESNVDESNVDESNVDESNVEQENDYMEINKKDIVIHLNDKIYKISFKDLEQYEVKQ